MVLDAVTITGSVRFALAGESKSGGAVHMNVPFGDSDITISPRDEFLVGIDFDAANSVDEVDDSGEINFDIIVNVDVKQVADGVSGHLDAINPSMGEFIAEASSAVKLNVIIARNGYE